jgi:hypothetical protein
MQTTSTTRPFGISGTMRTLLMTMGLALLFLTTTHPAGAQQQLPPGTAGTAQAEACGWMGGHATVDVDRTANGVRGTVVICGIKGLGGWWCVNTLASTTCKPLPLTAEQSSRWLEAVTGEVLPVLETGTVAQMQSAAAAFQASPLVQAELTRVERAEAAPQDQSASDKDRQDNKKNKHKSNKHKHGGKHGKGRKH